MCVTNFTINNGKWKYSVNKEFLVFRDKKNLIKTKRNKLRKFRKRNSRSNNQKNKRRMYLFG